VPLQVAAIAVPPPADCITSQDVKAQPPPPEHAVPAVHETINPVRASALLTADVTDVGAVAFVAVLKPVEALLMSLLAAAHVQMLCTVKVYDVPELKLEAVQAAPAYVGVPWHVDATYVPPAAD
jgi:hypothetical protein